MNKHTFKVTKQIPKSKSYKAKIKIGAKDLRLAFSKIRIFLKGLSINE